MSHEILVKLLERQEIFKNLAKYLKIIKGKVAELDPNAEVYLFGSVAEGNYNYSSDIDILIITNLYPANVNAELWKVGIKDPFEIHVYSPEKASFFKRAKLKKI